MADQRIAIDDVGRVVDQVGRRGKPGIRKIRSILEDRGPTVRNGSPLERRGAGLLRIGGLPEPGSILFIELPSRGSLLVLQ